MLALPFLRYLLAGLWVVIGTVFCVAISIDGFKDNMWSWVVPVSVVAPIVGLMVWRIWLVGVTVTPRTVKIRGGFRNLEFDRSRVVKASVYEMPFLQAGAVLKGGRGVALETNDGQVLLGKTRFGIWFGHDVPADDYVKRLNKALAAHPPTTNHGLITVRP